MKRIKFHDESGQYEVHIIPFIFKTIFCDDKLKAGAVTDRLFRLVAGVIETCLKRETTMK